MLPPNKQASLVIICPHSLLASCSHGKTLLLPTSIAMLDIVTAAKKFCPFLAGSTGMDLNLWQALFCPAIVSTQQGND